MVGRALLCILFYSSFLERPVGSLGMKDDGLFQLGNNLSEDPENSCDAGIREAETGTFGIFILLI